MSDTVLNILQSKYDRLIAHRGRLVQYYDDAPDGDPRKQQALLELNALGLRIVEVERQIEEVLR